jgi:hypothetical protein
VLHKSVAIISDNDLDDRKDEVWGMDEVRGSSQNDAETDGRGDTEQRNNTLDTSDTFETDDTVEGETVRDLALDAEAKNPSVRDLHNVNVYDYENLYREMVLTFKVLDGRYFAEHGDDLSKNKVFSTLYSGQVCKAIS